MGALGGKKLLSLAGLATVIVAPLSVLGWHSKDSSGSQLSTQNSDDHAQQAQTPQPSQLSDLDQAPQADLAPVSEDPSSSSTTTVTINGRQIPLSGDGQTHKVIQDGSTTTTLDVSVSNDVSGNSTFNRSVNSVSFNSYTEQSAGQQEAND